MWYINLNPMNHLVELFRSPIYSGRLPDLNTMIIAGIMAITSLFVGLWVFARKVDEFAYRI